MRTYGGLARFIVQMGSPVVDGLKRLEANKINATAFGLRNLEQLLTPSSREELMVTFNNPDAKMQDLDRAIQRARHSMWCGFVWSEHPDIDPGKRMPFVSLLSLHTSIHIFLKINVLSSFGGARLQIFLLYIKTFQSHIPLLTLSPSNPRS